MEEAAPLFYNDGPSLMGMRLKPDLGQTVKNLAGLMGITRQSRPEATEATPS